MSDSTKEMTKKEKEREQIEEKKRRIESRLNDPEFRSDDFIRQMNELEKRIESLTKPLGDQEPLGEEEEPFPPATEPGGDDTGLETETVETDEDQAAEEAPEITATTPQPPVKETEAPEQETEIVPYEFTKWSILATGEGAGRIASLYYGQRKNSAISDRILLLNTAEADIRKIFMTLGTSVPKDFVERIRSEKAFRIGNFPRGAGNLWKNGEQAAREDPLISDYIRGMGAEASDVLLGIATLGGGTGCGSLPFILNSLANWNIQVDDFALVVWPFHFESPQRHFNAICGLSKLLASNGGPEMVILVDNSRLEEDFRDLTEVKRNYQINEKIVEVIDMMIAPGTSGSEKTIDTKDFTVWANQFGARHFVPCLSLDMDPRIFKGFTPDNPSSFSSSLSAILDITLKNSYASIEARTTLFAFFVIRVPEGERDDYPPDFVERCFEEWAEVNLPMRISGYTSVVYDPGKRNSLDVLLLLGGFDLGPFIGNSLSKFETISKVLTMSSRDIKPEEVGRLKEDLLEYVESNSQIHANLS